MATTTSAVGGSVLDVQSLVSQIVAAERAPYAARIARDTEKAAAQISAIGTLKSALATFQTALASLKSTDSFVTRKAVSSAEAIFTASASGSAAPGSYDIEVGSLATAHQIASGPLANASTVVGTGTLTISLAASSFAVTIDSEHSRLSDIRDAINAAVDNAGVRASLINATGGSRLVLTSDKTGAANTIQVAQTGGDGGLAQLAYGPSDTSHYTQLAGAGDASVNIATYPVSSATNAIEGAIDGVTLNLAAADPGEHYTLTVTNDPPAVTEKVKSFVTAYNALQTQLVKLRSYDATTQTGGPMLGDAMLNGVESQLRRIVGAQRTDLSGAYTSLSSIGIATQADGSLKIDDAKLQKALSTGFETVGALFGGEKGVAGILDDALTDRLAAGAEIANRADNLVARQKHITQEQADLDARMEVIHTRYLKQFTALDGLLSQLQSTSSYLAQQLENLPRPNLNRR